MNDLVSNTAFFRLVRTCLVILSLPLAITLMPLGFVPCYVVVMCVIYAGWRVSDDDPDEPDDPEVARGLHDLEQYLNSPHEESGS